MDNKQQLKRDTGYVPIFLKIISSVFSIVFILSSFLFIFVLYLYGKYTPIINDYYKSSYDLVFESDSDTFRQTDNSYVYDNHGTCLAKLKTDKDTNYLKYSEIPKDVINAFVAVEDKRFYHHKGVDLKSTLKALYLLFENDGKIERGASTITQQLAKNIYLTNTVSYERKIREIFCALALEEKYSKDEILEFYINNIYFGNGYYGIGSASLGYFSKPVSELSVNEIAFLCAIVNNPTHYDPINNKENTLLRMDKILRNMVEQGYLNKAKYDSVKDEEIILKLSKQKFYNYEVSYAIECTIEYLMKIDGFKFCYDFSDMSEYNEYRDSYLEVYSKKREELFRGGYSVYTTIDEKVQKNVQKIVDKELSFNKRKTKDGVYYVQGATTVIDNNTGKVVAIVGGRSQKTDQRTLNRAFQSYNQPGSTFKPLAVYTPALEAGFTKESIVNDTYDKDGPHNSGDNYEGLITLYRAVTKSKNVVAWNLFNNLGPKHCLSYLQKMKFSRIVPKDYNLSSSLGGLTYGTSTVEMASGYATLYNDGVYRHPDCIKSIINQDGEEVYHHTLDDDIEVYSEYAARSMTEILQGVLKEKYGTAYGLALENNMPCAAKTGTTNEQKAAWFCGYSPYYTVSVWVGTDNNDTVDNLWGATYPGSIWKSVQDYLCKGKKIIEFKKPVKQEKKSGSSSKDKTADEIKNDVDSIEDEKIRQDKLISEIESLIAQYSSVDIDSWSSVDDANSLAKKIKNKINQVADSNKRNELSNKYKQINDIKQREINYFIAINSTEATTEATTEKRTESTTEQKTESTTEQRTETTTENKEETTTSQSTEASTEDSTSTAVESEIGG